MNDIKKEIQYISLDKENKFNLFKCNTLNSPESFNDFDINIIDFSDSYLWQNNENNKQKLNRDNDILNIAKMLKTAKSNILIILPQNIKYKYFWGTSSSFSTGRGFLNSEELKNMTEFLNGFIEKIISQNFKYNWLMYNKTSTKIKGKILVSDFVFKLFHDNQIITKSDRSNEVTTINYGGKFFTTLNLESEDDIMDLIEFFGWIDSKETAPKWFNQEHLFNDKELNDKKDELNENLLKITEEIDSVNEKLTENEFYKSALYKTGDELVEVVNIVLDELVGYDYNNFIDLKKEDFLIEKEDIVYIGEIKGIGTNVKNSNVSQTATHRDYYIEKEGNEEKNVVALSIITRQRLLSPKERAEVHKDVIKLAEMNNVLIISTETLLKMLEKLKINDIDKDDVKRILTTTKGILLEENIIKE